jgi:hypothetical protein
MTAERFMQVHEKFKMHNLCNLEIDVSALYLIAGPTLQEPPPGRNILNPPARVPIIAR